MILLELERFAHLPEGTLGQLTCRVNDGRPPPEWELTTIERPWRNNRPFVSCIPEGLYELEWDLTGRIRHTFRLRNVPARSQINIHAANRPGELHGCIAPGLDWNISGKAPTILHSRSAVELLLSLYDNELLGLLKDGQSLPIPTQLRIRTRRGEI